MKNNMIIPKLKTPQTTYRQFIALVDKHMYREAKELLTILLREEQETLVRAMVEYFQKNACKNCNGDGFTIEGPFGYEEERPCACQHV